MAHEKEQMVGIGTVPKGLLKSGHGGIDTEILVEAPGTPVSFLLELPE